jgi:hypothetical protein
MTHCMTKFMASEKDVLAVNPNVSVKSQHYCQPPTDSTADPTASLLLTLLLNLFFDPSATLVVSNNP